MKKINIVDMFCGGGGESTGLIEAAHDYNFDVNMSAINHWERAIETHAKNYPFAEHRCENVQHIEPRTLAASKNTDLMWASPGCQHFSVARGGKPRSEDMRSPAWEVLRFAEELRPKRIIIENVPEFRTWGPLDSNGKIIKECKGKTFDAFINGLKSLNYIVDYQVLCAADYGAATSRRRLFIQAVRKDCGKRILWPNPTNTKGGDLLLSDWKPASEIIDWSLPCQIISQRKKPLAVATMRRIEYGIREFWGEAAVPFIARLYGQSTAESIEKPLSTISCSSVKVLQSNGTGKLQNRFRQSVQNKNIALCSRCLSNITVQDTPFLSKNRFQLLQQKIDTLLSEPMKVELNWVSECYSRMNWPLQLDSQKIMFLQEQRLMS